MDEGKKFNLSEREEHILAFWKEQRIFEKSLIKRHQAKPFVFYEGPPTANGLPGVHHAETRAFKDAVLRYKTMRGFYVSRKAGWDTHGLPVEIEVEKTLGFKTKQDIERYGIAKFNKQAKESVWRYKDEWEKTTKRLGFWLDLAHPYITYETSYIETLWWIIKEIWKKGFLYKDFKVVPWCPRCQTGLSSHEVGLGYKKIKEASAYVRLRIQGRKNEYLLIWTTTPWTLPANVAVAIHPKIEYTKYKHAIRYTDGRFTQEYLWSATPPPYESGDTLEVVERVGGKSLLGLSYEPLFRVPREYSLGHAPEFRTIAGEFISTQEGTGMVHIAPAFGEEDMGVVRQKAGGEAHGDALEYPILHTVNPDGTMRKGVIGEGKFVKDADKMILEDLKRRGLLYRVVSHEHEYPFCWRCASPLLYFARTAWWIRMSQLREKLVRNNESIHWFPEHIKEGRFGEFLKEVRDWAFSRERFWGTPLPIWQCRKCGRTEVIGSREELAVRSQKAKNRYFIMRHGESLANVKNIVSYAPEGKFRMTLKGRQQVERAARRLKQFPIDLIFASDILRTKETAEVVAKVVGVDKIDTDLRLREINTGAFEGAHPREYHQYFSSLLEKFTKRLPEGETLTDVRKRVIDFLVNMEKKYSGKTILIVSHEYPLWMLYAGALGLSDEETVALRKGKWEKDFIDFAKFREITYWNLPRDEENRINLHRPYVDASVLDCVRCHNPMARVTEVADVWFDSGSMPFAQFHYPFEHKNDLPYPADYICEGVDMTRGWFYTLLAVATALGKKAPYRNVISLGLVLDKNGRKMSKSKGNAVDPGEMIKKYGADSLRWYFYTVNAPGEPKRFDENDLLAKLRGFLMTFSNCFALFDTYVSKVKNSALKNKSRSVLDQWVLAKLDLVVADVTKKLDAYNITDAARTIEEFVIRDFSQWYLRRSRKRFQRPESKEEKETAAVTTAEVLRILCCLSAPFIPFASETIYQGLRKKMRLEEKSVHHEEWPGSSVRQKKSEGQQMLHNMEIVRGVVAEALKLRAQAGVKVRQPLQKLQIVNDKFKSNPELLDLIKDEINVKEITFGKTLELDTNITPELREEGMARELVRNIQEMRRDLGLTPRNVIRVQFQGDQGVVTFVSRWAKMIKKETNARSVQMGGKKLYKVERELEWEEKSLWVGIET